MFEKVYVDLGDGPRLEYSELLDTVWKELHQEEKNEKNIKKAPDRNELPVRPDTPPLPDNRHPN